MSLFRDNLNANWSLDILNVNRRSLLRYCYAAFIMQINCNREDILHMVAPAGWKQHPRNFRRTSTFLRATMDGNSQDGFRYFLVVLHAWAGGRVYENRASNAICNLPHPGDRIQSLMENHLHLALIDARLPVHTENPQVGLPIAEGKRYAQARMITY